MFLMVLLSTQVAKAYDGSVITQNGQTIYYTVYNSRCNIVAPTWDWEGYTKPTGDLIIPNQITHNGETYAVRSIGYEAFAVCNGLTSVRISDSVEWINLEAFANCSSLTSVVIGSKVSDIGSLAFFNCSSLSSINIPDNVISIDSATFRGCSGLTSVTIGRGISFIGDNAFAECNNLSVVNFNADSCEYMIGYDEINYDTDFKSVFYVNSGLTTVNIGPSVRSLPAHAFDGCSSLTTVNFNADSCITMHTTSFNRCNNLSAVNFGDNVRIIPKYAFYECGITSVVIPDGVTRIGVTAFQNCSRLTSATIGSSVESIERQAFYNCDHLVNLISRAVYPPSCGDYVFYNIPQYCTLTVPCGSMQYYNVTSPWNTIFQLINEDCEGIDDASADIIHISCIDGRIVVEGGVDMKVSVYDMMGHIIRNESLPTGVYMVKVGSLPAHKVVVIR